MSDDQNLLSLLHAADTARGQGTPEAADALYRRVLSIDPVHAEALRHHVVLAAKLGHPEQALAALENAARVEPDNPEWPFGRALLLADARLWEEAVAAYDQALTLRPDDFVSRWGRAGALVALGRLEDALADHDRGLTLRPDAVESHMARGGVLTRLRRFDDALAAYDRAIALRADFAEAWFAKALLLLSLGRYKEGWPLYEWRWFIPGTPGQERLFAQPMWDGAPLGDRTLYIHSEQGLGDSIQFYRFVRQAKRLGQIVLGVSERLGELFASQPDAPAVVVAGQPMPHIDLHCPMMSLPWLLNVELHTLPSAPYLGAAPRRAMAWQAKLASLRGRPRIGIVWAGNKNNAEDQNRSLPLSLMLRMLRPDAAVVSLQMNVPHHDVATLRNASHVLDLSQQQQDMAETAAVISQLDLVISVDTSVAHLAGAMGKPVWILLPEPTGWRWLRDREDSPWYPSARLFRQVKAGDWTDVAARVREAVRTFPTAT